MMTIGEHIKRCRIEKGISQEEIASQLAITRNAVSQWENNRAHPKLSMIPTIANILGVSISDLMEDESSTSDFTPANHQVRVLGTIHAGEPLLAVQEDGEAIQLPVSSLPQGQVFALKVQGDSMDDDGIRDGELALILQSDCAEDGDIVAVIVNGDEATIKRIKYLYNAVALCPSNKAKGYLPIICREEDVHIIGVLVGSYRDQRKRA